MKTYIINLFLLPLLIVGVGLILADPVTAQTFTVLHSFTATYPPGTVLGTNSDGAGPATLMLSGNTLYGTTYTGGPSGNGTVFKVNTNGTGFTTLYYGHHPSAQQVMGLILAGNTLYGTAAGDGSSDNGVVFAVNTDGT